MVRVRGQSARDVRERPPRFHLPQQGRAGGARLDLGKAPVRLVLLPDALEDEDAMEMVNAGLLQIIVVDDWKAAMWAQILPGVKVREDLVVRAAGYVG